MIVYRESNYKELIERIKIPGYLDKFIPFFQKTKRMQTIPEMIMKRHGLYDGKKWTYKEISMSFEWVVNSPIYVQKREHLSPERIRQCLTKGYRVILKHEKEVHFE